MPPLDNAGLDSGDTVNSTLARLRTSTAQPVPDQSASDSGYNVFQGGNKIGWLTDPSKAPPGATVIPVSGGEPVSGGQTQVASAAIPPPAAGDPGVRIQQESAGNQFDKTGAPLIPAQFKGKPDEWNAPVGVTQVRPSTAYGFFPNVDLLKLQTDPAYNKAVGNAVHSKLYQQYGNNATMADIAYDWGTGHLDHLLKTVGDPRKGQISWAEFTTHLPAETQAYITANGTHSPVSHQSDSKPAGAPEQVVSGTGYSEMFPVKNIFDEMRATQYGAKTEADATLKDIRRSLSELSKPPPTVQPTQPTEVWGSLAMAVAALGGLLTHTPATTALNAMGGVMKAFSEGDQARAEMAMKQWKVANDALLRTAKMKVDLYSDAMSRYKEAPEQAKAELMANAAALNDQAMLQLLEKGDWQGAMAMGSGGINAYIRLKNESTKTEQALNDRATALQIIQERTEAQARGDQAGVEAANQKMKDLAFVRGQTAATVNLEAPQTKVSPWTIMQDTGTGKQLRTRTGPDGKPEYTDLAGNPVPPPAGVTKAAPQSKSILTGEALDKAARFFHDTHQLPPGFGGQADRDAIMNREAEMYPGDTNASARTAMFKSDQGSLNLLTKQRDSAKAYESAAKKEMDLAVSLMPDTPQPMDSQLLTRWVRTGATQFGDVKVPKFQAALISALDEYAKVLSGSTGSVAGSTDAARAQAMSLIPPGATTEQIPAIIDTLKQGMDFKITSYDAQIDEIRGRIGGGSMSIGESKDASHPDNLPDGTIVTQGGVKYRKSNGTWDPVQ